MNTENMNPVRIHVKRAEEDGGDWWYDTISPDQAAHISNQCDIAQCSENYYTTRNKADWLCDYITFRVHKNFQDSSEAIKQALYSAVLGMNIPKLIN